MSTKPQAPGQWADQQKAAEKPHPKKRAQTPRQVQQSSGLQPMDEPAKQHGDKLKTRPDSGDGT
jgi:hypothetical protein